MGDSWNGHSSSKSSAPRFGDEHWERRNQRVRLDYLHRRMTSYEISKTVERALAGIEAAQNFTSQIYAWVWPLN